MSGFVSEQLFQVSQTQQRPSGLAQVKDFVAIASATGGTGKSTLVASLAFVLALKKRKIGIIDANLENPAIASMLGVRHVPVLSLGGVVEPASGPLGIRLIGNDPEANRPPISFVEEPATQDFNGIDNRIDPGAEPPSLQAILNSAHFGALDLLLLDMPPGFAHVLTLAKLLPEVNVVLVTTPSALAVAAARRALTRARAAAIRVIGLVENMQNFYCGGCQSVRPLLPQADVAALARDFDLPLLGRLPFDFRLAECCDNGRIFTREYHDTPVAKLLGELAQHLLSALNAPAAGTQVGATAVEK